MIADTSALWPVILALFLLQNSGNSFTPPSTYRYGAFKNRNCSIRRLVHKFTAFVDDQDVTSPPASLEEHVLQVLQSLVTESNAYAESLGLGTVEAAFYGLFAALRRAPVSFGLKGVSFCLRNDAVCQALGQESGFPGFFTLKDLERAVEDDFLDAVRGSTDNRKGWQITAVSVPRGDSFEDARMTFPDICKALEKGTVILNAAGAHIPKLAGPSLACTDATLLPCALNLYITAADQRTSAPPHTDKQDVLVVQTQGRKHWKVFAPPDPSLKPESDVFARGKTEDNLSLYSLVATSELVLETTLNPGDILFVPAGFPHTTATVLEDSENLETSLHLTLGIDHHIWGLDYLQTIQLALRRACVTDSVLDLGIKEENPFVGHVNQLPTKLHRDIMAELPLGLLDTDERADGLLQSTLAELERLSNRVHAETEHRLESSILLETLTRVRQEGRELLQIHQDMYLAAIEEGRIREAEDAISAHLNKYQTMSPERIQRLSLFRVKRYYDQINGSLQSLRDWSFAKKNQGTEDDGTLPELAVDWAFDMPVKVGDQVEAELGGAFFPATVTRASGNSFDVAFFDGDQESGLNRSMIKLLSPPSKVSSAGDFNPSLMTSKQSTKQREKNRKNK